MEFSDSINSHPMIARTLQNLALDFYELKVQSNYVGFRINS